MFQQLKHATLTGLEGEIHALGISIQDRRDWLEAKYYPGEPCPKFVCKYTNKSLETRHKHDYTVDKKLSEAEENEELSVESHEKIAVVKKQLARDITAEERRVKNLLHIQFRNNPELMNLSDEDAELVWVDNDKYCAGIKRRLTAQAQAQEEIRKIVTSPGSSRANDTGVISKNEESRTRAELQFYAGAEVEIKRGMRSVENYFLMTEEDISEEDKNLIIAEEKTRIERDMNRKIAEFKANCDRTDRMNRADEIRAAGNYDQEAHSKLMKDYRHRMKRANVQYQPSANWDRALKDIDLDFTHCPNNWEFFMEKSVMEYWCLLAEPEKENEYEDIISKYAYLYLGSAKEVDIPFHEQVASLRTRRDNLLGEVRRLDRKITERCTIPREVRTSKPIRAVKISVPRVLDYPPSSNRETIVITWGS